MRQVTVADLSPKQQLPWGFLVDRHRSAWSGVLARVDTVVSGRPQGLLWAFSASGPAYVWVPA